MAKKRKNPAKPTGIKKEEREAINEILTDGNCPEIVAGKSLPIQSIDLLSRYKKCLMAGFTQQETIDTLKIDKYKYFALIKQVPEELRDEWRAVKIMSVENSVLMSANGFSKTIYEDVVDKEGITHTLAKEKYFPPNVNAQKYFLNNMSSRDWKDRSELVVNNVENMPMSELEQRVQEILQKKKEKKIASLKQLELNRQGVEIVEHKEEGHKKDD